MLFELLESVVPSFASAVPTEVPSTRTVYVSPSLISAEEKITLLIEPSAVAVQRVLPEESCTVITLPSLMPRALSRFGRLPDGFPSALPPGGLGRRRKRAHRSRYYRRSSAGSDDCPSAEPFASPGGVMP